MNLDLIFILDAFVKFHTHPNRQFICSKLQLEAENCSGVVCSECIMQTNHIFNFDYPIRIIEIWKIL